MIDGSSSDAAFPKDEFVFIDSRVPDLQTLLDSVAAGARVFILGPGSDGLKQIAAILAEQGASGLANISIVAHGGAGKIQIGNSVLDDAALAAEADVLAAIGATLAADGSLSLYACDTAEGAGGRQFIADLSRFAGGVNVQAATHLVGGADLGGSFDLDAATGQTGGVSPFSEQLLEDFEGTLVGGVSGQLWIGFGGPGTGNPDGHSDFRVIHADSDGLADDVIIADEQAVTGLYNDIDLDTSAGLFISLDNSFHLRITSMSTGADLSSTVVASTADQDQFSAIAVNDDTNTIFGGLFGYDYLADGGDIIKITYNQTTGAIVSPYSWNDTTHAFSINLNNVLIDSTSTGHKYAYARAMQLSADNSTLYYVDDNNNDPGNFWGFSTNGVFKVSTTGSVGGGNAPTPVLLSSQAQFPVNDSNGYISGIEVDEGRGIIYFTTNSSAPGVNTSQNAIWWMPITGGTATKMTIPSGVTVTYPYFIGDALSLDTSTHTLYYSDQSTGIISKLVLSADGHSFDEAGSGTFLNVDSGSFNEAAGSLTFDVLPTLGSLTATTTEAVQGGGAITLLTATPTLSDPDNLRLHHLTVTVTNAQAGDNLYVNGQQSGTISGVTISWNSSTHALTLSGDVAFSTYQSLMALVQYQDAGTDGSSGSHPTRTINWTVSDGVTIGHPSTLDSNEQTTTAVIDRAPTLTADNYAVVETATVTGTAGTADALPPGTGVLGNDNDKDADAITVTAVQGSGGNVGNSVAGTYGHLTLNANGSYSYIADNAVPIGAAANGSKPLDTFTYTVSDGLGGVTSSTVSFTVDRAPTAVADNPSGQALESGSAVTGNVLTNDSDKDADTLTVSAVAGSGGNVGVSIAGTYGHITINANGSYSYSADNTVAIDGAATTGSHLTDDINYTADDGFGGTATASLTVTIDRPTTAVLDNLTTSEDASAVNGSGGNANLLANDSDNDGDGFVITAVNGSGTDVGTEITLASGALLTLNADGTYIYDPNGAFNYVPGSGSGASNIIVDDSFTYALTGGSTATVTVSVAGIEGDNDTLMGSPGGDHLTAGSSNDTLYGRKGDDSLSGGDGNDLLVGGPGADDMDGGAGDDLFFVDDPGDTVADSSGSDRIYTTVDFTLSPGQAIEYLVGQGSVGLTLTGNEFNNGIYGTTGADTMDGGAGDDFFFIDNPGDTVADSSGSDRIYTTVDFTLSPGQAIEYLVGQGSVGLTLTGNELNNGIYGTTGADTMDGGAGDDFFFVDNPGDTVADSSGSDRIYTTVDFTLSPGQAIEYLVGQGSVGLTLTGNELNNAIYGGTGADTMDGGAGDDLFFVDNPGDTVADSSGSDRIYTTVDFALSAGLAIEYLVGQGSVGLTLTGNELNNAIYGGTGADTMDGGAGDDLFFVNNPGDTVADSSGSDRIYTTVDFALSAGLAIEYLVGQGSVGLTLTGNELNNAIYGGTGADTMDGGAGDDLFFVNNPGDTVADSSGSDRIYTTANFTLSAGLAIEFLVGQGSVGLTLTGNELNNGIYGTTGVDTMDGGAGDDYFYVNNPADTVTDSSGSDRIYTTANFTLSAGLAIEFLVGQGSVGLTLTGNDLDNRIYGGAGADTITGRAGLDVLTGGNGGDVFVYNAASDSGVVAATRDQIFDFAQGSDTMDLSAIDAIAGGSDDAFTFIGTNAFSGAAGELRYQAFGGDTLVSADLAGTSSASFSILLKGSYTLTATDFVR